MYESTTEIRVRYGETDRMGFLYHGHYATYYEIGRTESFRQLGLTYLSMEEKGVIMPVTDLSMKFLAPALYDEIITVKTTVSTIPAVRMIVNAELMGPSGVIINRSEVKLTFLDAKNKSIMTAPQYLLDLLNPYFK
jgi:acyl-CoA thioester hydrolase